jgi:alginate O-acetyltransferase complex protein AlgI
MTDFWRRWHMSLSSWFRDYVYIPLGGSRRGPLRTYVNLGTVFLLTGMWHGANWTFILWGCFHGTCLIVERLTGLGTTEATRHVAARRVVTFALVCMGWGIFRARGLDQAWAITRAMVVPSGLDLPVTVTDILTNQRLLWFGIGLAVVLLPRRARIGRMISLGTGKGSETLRVAVLLTVAPLAALYAMSSTFSPFLYFKF